MNAKKCGIIVLVLAVIAIGVFLFFRMKDTQLEAFSEDEAEIVEEQVQEEEEQEQEEQEQEEQEESEQQEEPEQNQEEKSKNNVASQPVVLFQAGDTPVTLKEIDHEVATEEQEITAGQGTGEYLLENSDSRRISESELHSFDADMCRYARNEIYARHGRKFQDEDLQAYFDQKSWYHGTINPDAFLESELNETEIYNRDLIVEYEKKKGYR